MKMNSRTTTVLCCLLVLIASYFTYFKDYHEPPNAFYDEIYHIVGAEKYINRVMYFEVHPPVGKLFIALGEALFNTNKNLNLKEAFERGYIDSDLPENFSFIGVRFFPVLFGCLNALLFFIIFYLISKNNLISLLFSSLYLFENSSIVHFRAAMLDSTLVFFVLLSLICFICLYDKKKKISSLNYFLLGVLTSFAIFTKIVGLVLVLLFFFLQIKELNKYKVRYSLVNLKRLLKDGLSYSVGLITVFILVYYLHVTMGANTVGTYTGKASARYLEMIKTKEIFNPLKLYIPIRDNLIDMKKGHSSIEKLDVCKLNEVGSHPIGWPLGIRNINYLKTTGIDGGRTAYLTFQGNPVNWFMAIFSVFICICLVVSRTMFNTEITDKRTYNLIRSFTLLYVAYMVGIVWGGMHRVLYIHIYLLPLFLSFILSFLLFYYLFKKYLIKKDKIIYLAVILLVIQIVYFYTRAYAITYFQPITYSECSKTRLIDFWKDTCVK